MKTLDVNEAIAHLAEYAQDVDKETVILTLDGHPVAALLPIKDVDWETIALSTNPEFQAILARSRARLKAEGGIASEEMSRLLGVKPEEQEAFADVYDILYEFKGGQIPGNLLNMPGEVMLPTFTEVDLDYRVPGTRQHVDMLAQGAGAQWAIEIKTSPRGVRSGLDQIQTRANTLKATPWLIAFCDLSPAMREAARQGNVYLTGRQEWQALKALVTGPDPAPSA